MSIFSVDVSNLSRTWLPSKTGDLNGKRMDAMRVFTSSDGCKEWTTIFSFMDGLDDKLRHHLSMVRQGRAPWIRRYPTFLLTKRQKNCQAAHRDSGDPKLKQKPPQDASKTFSCRTEPMPRAVLLSDAEAPRAPLYPEQI